MPPQIDREVMQVATGVRLQMILDVRKYESLAIPIAEFRATQANHVQIVDLIGIVPEIADFLSG